MEHSEALHRYFSNAKPAMLASIRTLVEMESPRTATSTGWTGARTTSIPSSRRLSTKPRSSPFATAAITCAANCRPSGKFCRRYWC